MTMTGACTTALCPTHIAHGLARDRTWASNGVGPTTDGVSHDTASETKFSQNCVQQYSSYRTENTAYIRMTSQLILFREIMATCCGNCTSMRHITTFQSTTDHIYDDGPIRLYYNIILYYNTYHCVTVAYSIQYSNMLYRFVA